MDVTNGNYVLLASGFSNRRTHRDDQIFNLFHQICKVAPGSYGLIYYRDIDDPIIGNEFKVWRLAKGNIKEMNEPFLSPCVPVIEDEEEDNGN